MIEKNIWQTYKLPLSDNPDYIKHTTMSWVEKNPSWSYNYLSDEDIRDFFLEEFGKDWSNLIERKCIIPVMKADVWRVMALYQYGGMYADIDTICTDSIDNWIKEYSAKKFLVSHESLQTFCQWSFLSCKSHPALEDVLNSIYQALEKYDVGRNSVYEMTGPEIFTNSILKNIKIDKSKTIQEQNWDINHSEYFIKNRMHVIEDDSYFKTGKVVHLGASKFWKFEDYQSWNDQYDKIKEYYENI